MPFLVKGLLLIAAHPEREEGYDYFFGVLFFMPLMLLYATAATMLKSGAALSAAKKSAAGNPLHLGHVELAELPTLYVVLPIFKEVVAYAKTNNVDW